MKIIRFLVRQSPRTLVVAMLAGILCGASTTSIIAIINGALGHGRFAMRTLVGAFALLCISVPVTRYASQVLLVQLGQRAIFDLRMRLSRQILKAPLRKLEEIGAHRLLVALTEDITGLTTALIIIPIICINLAIVVGCLIYLGWLSGLAFVIMIGFFLLMVPTYQLIVRSAVRSLKQAREVQDGLFKSLRLLTEGIKELKLHRERRQAFIDELLESTAQSVQQHNIRGMKIYSAGSSWGQVLIFILLGLLLFALPALVQIDARILTGYTLTLLYMMAPLEVLLNAAPALTRADISLKKVESLGLSLSEQSPELDSTVAGESKLSWSTLELSRVSHVYSHEGEDGSFVLGPLDVTFVPGELVFLIGGNGSGKTTLAKLLVGLYAPEEGEIYLDGQAITDANREPYRQLFSVVFSDFCLFDSLLGLGASKPDAQARAYLQKLQLDKHVQIENSVLSTTALSQGQRKRLALLTAYLEDRPFYVFDEWAADQDPLFKQVFYYQLLPELKERNKTVLVISHDDRYYHVADRIIKLDCGQIQSDEWIGESQFAATKLIG